MKDVDRPVKPFLDFDLALCQYTGAGFRQELEDAVVQGDGVVIGDCPGGFGTEHSTQVQTFWSDAEGGNRVPGFDAELAGVVGDEGFVEVAGGCFGGGDVVVSEFGDEAALEGAVEALDSAFGLWGVGEDGMDSKSGHGDLEGGGFVVTLMSVDPVVAGSGELAGSVDIEAFRQAVAAEDAVEHLEAAVTGFLRMEATMQRLTGGVIGAEDEGKRWPVLSEPGMGAAVQEDQFALAGSAFSLSEVASSCRLPGVAEALGSEPAADSLIADGDVVFLGQDLGEMGEVEVEEVGLIESDDLIVQFFRLSDGRDTAAVAMDDPGLSVDSDLCFQPEDLAAAESQHPGGLS